MGWLPFTSSTRGDEIRSGTAIPTRSERAVCWAARDAYYGCLDAHNIVDASKEPGASAAAKACPEASAAFEQDCAAAWVKYFKQWRVADIQKRRRIEQLQAEGAVEANVTSSFAGGGNISGAGGKAQATKEDIQAMLDKKRG
ncbi:Cytochrome c oxidase, subunit VIb [Akanthomyces lecanii RCEF 1005]|uniref:Cytochrome c oxidase, subunit VIb n=1 Tax=Akanthomyces lecanii RCEF 1005 TaxID=1081108 RepID=A0A162K7A0_CORDF|nr:Cytochrome c oxidase, subunit VIb [Akanthomyces lecanii RCEF 1005]